MAFLSALCAGMLFGLGLLLSRMCDPERVLGFLDVAGDWNPALAFTMGGAILVAAPAFLFVRRGGRNALGVNTELPNRFKIDRSLLSGAALFGMGWGLSGVCPGPSMLLLTGGTRQSGVFFLSMLGGFWSLNWWRRRRR